MLFKPWLDVPAARHELHDESSDDEQNHPDISDELYEFSSDKHETESEQIIVLCDKMSFDVMLICAYPLEAILLACSSHTAQIGSVQVRFKAVQGSLQSIMCPIMSGEIGNRSVAWIRVRQVPAQMAYPFAEYLFNILRPKSTVILTCLPSIESEISLLSTSSCSLSEDLQSLLMKPPNYVTGIYAAVISKAELESLSAALIAVSAEGIVDHEFVEDEIATKAATVLGKLLSANSAIELNMAVFRKHQAPHSSMYV
ncbi:uncharacterized protein V1516DRAFT_671200 [Lipomyces oligophaga]|uniref:uncharacterized protein n=1 Tax=Lipomyces oligophaga TaxID=45792 RepID=UPI0034CD9E4D